MPAYSYNQNRDGVVFAHAKDLNASFKDLGVVCDAIRYKSIPVAVHTLDQTISRKMPILYKKHNASMGARHELGGKKGRWPIWCAEIVKKVLVNAMANARNKNYDPEAMYVVHAAANKTFIAKRGPSVGPSSITGGPSGYSGMRRMNLEFARVELGISMLDEKRLGKNTAGKIKFTMSHVTKEQIKAAQGVIIKKQVTKKSAKKGEKKEEKKPLIAVEKEKSAEEKKELKKESKQEEKREKIEARVQ